MLRRLFPPAALLSLCLLARSASAARPVKEFVPPSQMSSEELAASKERSKTRINAFDQDLAAETQPVPWMEILFFGLVFAGAAPFAWRAYRNTAREISAPSPTRRPARDEDGL